MSYYFYKPYVTVAQKEAKAVKKLAQLRKKNPDILPVVIQGNALAKTWWGKAWNKNLECYADYRNRIGRGRSYVRHRAVLDLQINKENVTALVQGSESKPYSVEIKIEPVKKNLWKNIKEACAGKIDSLPEILEGEFPKDLAEIFTARGAGLFPTPKEIKFSCSCPDWASMCKHVAAALYGIGARLDENPLLFFTLRNVDVMELISEAVEDRTRNLLNKAESKSARVLENVDLEDMFDIDLEEDEDLPATTEKTAKTEKKKAKTKKQGKGKAAAKEKPKAKPKKKGSAVSKKAKAKAAPTKKKAGPAKKTPIERKPAKTDCATEKYATVAEIVENAIPKSRKGITVAAIVKKTGFGSIKVYNTLARLKKAGKIENVDRGVYRRI